jgi:hypothetical protein
MTILAKIRRVEAQIRIARSRGDRTAELILTAKLGRLWAAEVQS